MTRVAIYAIAAVLVYVIGHEVAVSIFGAAHGMTFIGQARKRNQILGTIANDQGQLVPKRIDLRNAGYLDRLRLLQAYDFQFATASPGAADPFAQAGGQLARLSLQSNSVGLLYDVTGEIAKVISAIDDSQRNGVVATLDPLPNKFTAAPAQSATTNIWAAEIPIATYFNNKPWPIGLYQMALNALEVSLEVRFRPLYATATTPGSGIYLQGSSTKAQDIRGDLYIQQQYYDPIADPASQPTLAFIHQWREFQLPLTGDQDNDFRLPPSNLYMRVIYWPVFAGALTGTPVTKLQLRYGANFAPFEEYTGQQFTNGLTQQNRLGHVAQRMARLYGNPIGVAGAGPYDGLIVHDFFADNDNEQDFINSAATTELRATLTTSGGTYTNPSYCKIATEQLIPLVVPTPGTGNVQGVS